MTEQMIISHCRETSETKKFVLEMKDFMKTIQSLRNEERRPSIESQEFTVGEARFKFEFVDHASSICVALLNLTDGNQTISATLEHDSGARLLWIKVVLEEGDLYHGVVMPSKDYKKWARSNGDVFILEVSITLHHENPAAETPITRTLRAKAVNELIMGDESTKDYSVRCDTKTFRVHKSFLCARSDVFRAMIQGSMREAIEGEVYIKDIDEETLNTVITFIYTGDFLIHPGQDINVQGLARAADKYNLAGMMEILCSKLGRIIYSTKPATIADMLITASRHDNKQLRELVLDRIRTNRNIMNDKDFRKRMDQAHINIAFDLFSDL